MNYKFARQVGCGCDYCASSGVRRNFRRDHGSDGFEDTPYRKSGKKTKKKKTGCPGNDNGSHVYVWISYSERYGYNPNYSIFDRYEYRVCCGCGIRPARKSFRVRPRN